MCVDFFNIESNNGSDRKILWTSKQLLAPQTFGFASCTVLRGPMGAHFLCHFMCLVATGKFAFLCVLSLFVTVCIRV